MAHEMQRGVSQSVGRVERLARAPRPERTQSGYTQALGLFVPKAIMHLDRQRNFRIEMAPAVPLPAGLQDQRRQMVGRMNTRFFDRFVALIDEEVPGAAGFV